MREDDILIADSGCQRTLTLNRSRKANALTAGMMDALGLGIEDSPGEINVLRSASATLFCAGADIAGFAAGGDHIAEMEGALVRMIGKFAHSRTPLVVLARGKASGAGALLLALADVVIAADDLELGWPEIQFGMFPVIVEAVLQSRLASALAARICLGHPLSADAAHGVGLVTEILPRATFDTQSEDRLAFYLERASGMAMARRSRQLALPPEALMAHVHAVAPLMAENFAQAGVQARILSYLDILQKKRAT
jgi:enoyl-CoA hydratase/carnithine racemase